MTITTSASLGTLALSFSIASAAAAQVPASKAVATPKAATDAARAVEPRPVAEYGAARAAIEQGQYDQAIVQLNNLIDRFAGKAAFNDPANRLDAALYWKAYSEAKQRQVREALATVEEIRTHFADSRWLKDAMALSVELRQAAGQAVSPEAQPDDELKLLALRGLMQTDPDRALPMIEQLLSGNSSVKVKENALFVLSQSQSARGREILAQIARGASNPDLQLRAIRYLGAMRGADSAQILADAYKASSDERVKRAIIRSFMISGDRSRLSAIANDTAAPAALRGEAIQQLGVLKADDELLRLYARESSPELKHRIIQGLFVGNAAGRLVELARTEKDINLRKDIVQKLSFMKSSEATDYLVELLK